MEGKVCPMSIGDPADNINCSGAKCIQEKCEWWVRGYSESTTGCALKVIAATEVRQSH